jgi:hypothetical protein
MIVNIVPGSPVPLTIGVLSPVVLPFIGHMIVSGGGAAVSTMNVVVLTGLVFPAASIVVTLRVLDPSGREVVGVKL